MFLVFHKKLTHWRQHTLLKHKTWNRFVNDEWKDDSKIISYTSVYTEKFAAIFMVGVKQEDMGMASLVTSY